MANTEGNEAVADISPVRESKPLTFAHRRSNMTSHIDMTLEKISEIERHLKELKEMLR